MRPSSSSSVVLALAVALTLGTWLAAPTVAQAQSFDPSWSGTVTRKSVTDDRGDPTTIGSSEYAATFDGTDAGGHADGTERITQSSTNVGMCAPNTVVINASGSGEDRFGITPLGPGGGSYVLGTSGIQLNGTFTNSNTPCASGGGPYQTVINVGNNGSENEAEGTTTDPDSVEGSHTSHLNASTTVVVTWRMTRAPDRDHDGFRDTADHCPDTYAPPTSTDGCPEDPDRDHDGFPNGRDGCPDSYAPTSADGCPDDDPACDDGKDNDGDGSTDFPADLGCTSAADTSEMDPPVCSDGRDNDADGNVDFPEDVGCLSASDGDEEDCTIIGTPGKDALVGTRGNDIICGLGGDDGISGDDGDDVLRGGAGRDRILGGPGNDKLEDSGGDDQLRGGPGRDVLAAGSGDDLLGGGAGADTLEGGPGADTAAYISAPHAISADLATGKISGEGADAVSGLEIVLGSSFADQLRGGPLQEHLLGGDGNDALDGRGGNDLVTGGGGADRLVGGNGADVLVGGDGINKANGGSGFDVCFSTHATPTACEFPYHLGNAKHAQSASSTTTSDSLISVSKSSARQMLKDHVRSAVGLGIKSCTLTLAETNTLSGLLALAFKNLHAVEVGAVATVGGLIGGFIGKKFSGASGACKVPREHLNAARQWRSMLSGHNGPPPYGLRVSFTYHKRSFRPDTCTWEQWVGKYSPKDKQHLESDLIYMFGTHFDVSYYAAGSCP